MSLLRKEFPCPGGIALLFDQPVAALAGMRDAIALLTMITADHLRCDQLLAQKVVVWMEKMATAERMPHLATRVMDLPVPVASTGVLAAFTEHAVNELYEPGARYRQAGVYCDDLSVDQTNLVTRLRSRLERTARPYGIVSRARGGPQRSWRPAWT